MNAAEARVLLEDLLHRIAPEADVASLAPDAPIRDALDLDSMDFLHLVSAVGRATGVEIPERDYASVSTLAGFAEYLSSARQR